MILNIDTTNNTLLSTDIPSYAEGTITQDTGENDFSSVKNLISTWNLTSVLTVASTDSAKINTRIFSDSIIIISYNNNYYRLDNIYASDIKDPIFLPMTSNTTPEGTVLSSSNASDAWQAFDNDDTTYTTITDASTTGNLGYKFKNNESYKILEYYLKTGDNSGADYSLSNGWTIEGSTDGVNWSTIGDYQGIDNINKAITGGFFKIQSPGVFQAYRLVVTSTNNPRIYTFNLIDPNNVTLLDTTSITSGGTIDDCFVSSDKILFNNIESTKIDIDWSNITLNGTKLRVNITHSDNDLGGINTNIITNRIEINSIGNEFISLDSDLYKNTNKPV